MTTDHRCPHCNASRGRHGRCDRCGGPIPVRPGDSRGAALLNAEAAAFDLADQELGIGDSFRWPCGDGARHWRIVAVIDPHVDDLVQRVRATPVGRSAVRSTSP